MQAISHLSGLGKPELSREGIFPSPRLPDQHFHGTTKCHAREVCKKTLAGERSDSNARQVWEGPPSEQYEVNRVQSFFLKGIGRPRRKPK